MSNSEKLNLGERYSRKALESLLDESKLSFNREGIYYCNNDNSILIFTDLVKEGKFTYNDFFENDFFHWDSQSNQHINTPRIKDIIGHQKEILLFCRLHQKIKNKTQPNIYCGRLKYFEYEKNTNNPVHIIFESLDYDDQIENIDLKDIWNWKPGKKTTAIDKSKVISSKREKSYKKPDTTERQGLVTSRVGQGYYRQNILRRWQGKCAVSQMGIDKILIASHIVPWKDSNDDQRLDTGNGILLSPNLDALFDKHLISFENNGKILISDNIDKAELEKLGINKGLSLLKVFEDMYQYLEVHRKIFYRLEWHYLL